ncbi:hypothetical protein D3C86_1831840 [compost metagenome]
MKGRQDLFLQYVVYIDEHIPAGYHVIFNEWRRFDHIMFRKYYLFPDLRQHPVKLAVFYKIFFKQRGGHFFSDRCRVLVTPGNFNALFVNIGSKDLYIQLLACFFQAFIDQYGYGIGFLPGTAGTHPYL